MRIQGKLSVLVIVWSLRLHGAVLQVNQTNVDVSTGWQTRQIYDSPYTNYFALSTNGENGFFTVESNQLSFDGMELVNVTNNWYGNYGVWTVTTNSTQHCVTLDPNSGSFSIQFSNVYQGLYGVQIFGVVTDNVAYYSVRLPLIWKISANDAQDGSTNIYHTLSSYIANRNYDIGQFWIQAVRNYGPSNNILVTASLDPASMVHAKLVAVHIFSPVDWSDTNVYKSSSTLFTSTEWQTQTNYAYTNSISGTILNWKNGSPALPDLTVASNLTNLFNRWMPLNSTFDETQGTYATNTFGTNQWYPTPYHSVAQYYGSDYATPWGWTNIQTGSSFSLSDYLSGNIVPGTTNDYLGFYYSNVWLSTFGSFQGFGMYRAFVMPMLLNNFNGNLSLPYRFFNFAYQTNAAHSAGLILAKFALTYPTYRLEAMDINPNIQNPSAYLNYNEGRWSLRRTGKLEYDGWAGLSQPLIAQAVDYLWPYVSTSTAFASDLSRFVPWVNSDTNRTKLFFEYLLRSLAFDNGFRDRGADPMQLGLVMQSGTISSNLMNPSVASLTVTPAPTANIPWIQTYAGTYNRDGVNLIGSSFYVLGENALLSGPDETRRYKSFGGNPGPLDISNPTNFPKLQAFGKMLSQFQVNYGYSASFGDSGGGINNGPFVQNFQQGLNVPLLYSIWQLYPEPRIGKYIHDVDGRTTESDSDWNTMTAQSASTTFDMRYPTVSRILSGVGVGALELGTTSTNQLQRGTVFLRTVSGSGHDHGDHLDFGLYAFGCKMGTDIAQRNEGTDIVYPDSTSTRVHNEVEVDGYDHPTKQNNGWPGGDNGGGYSQYTAFATNGSVQFIGADLWNGANHTNVTYQHRDLAMCSIDASNFYVVDFQRVNGGRFYSWSFHGADVGGETSGFTTSIALTNSIVDFTDGSAENPTYFLRKYSTTAAYPLQQSGYCPSQLWAEWRLGRTAMTAVVTNGDGNGGSVTTIAPEQAMFGSAYDASTQRKITRTTLFDRTNDIVTTGWLLSQSYDLLQPRLSVITKSGTQYFTNATEMSSTWAALYDAYIGTRIVSTQMSLATSSTLTNAWMPKAIEVVTPAGIDYHYSSGTNVDVVVGSDTFNGQYAFARDVSGTPVELKLINGTKLIHGGYTLTVATNDLSQSISAVNWTNGTITFSAAWPGAKKVGWYRFHNANHETSYYITSWISAYSANYYGDALVGRLDITNVSGSTIQFSSANGGMALASYPKLGAGLTGANESFSKIFQVSYSDTVGTSATWLGGNTISTSDFTDVDGDGHVSALLYDIGPSDAVETPVETYVKKNNDGTWTISSNASFTFSGFNAGLQISGVPLTGGTVQLAQITGEPQIVGPASQTTISNLRVTGQTTFY